MIIKYIDRRTAESKREDALTKLRELNNQIRNLGSQRMMNKNRNIQINRALIDARKQKKIQETRTKDINTLIIKGKLNKRGERYILQ